MLCRIWVVQVAWQEIPCLRRSLALAPLLLGLGPSEVSAEGLRVAPRRAQHGGRAKSLCEVCTNLRNPLLESISVAHLDVSCCCPFWVYMKGKSNGSLRPSWACMPHMAVCLVWGCPVHPGLKGNHNFWGHLDRYPTFHHRCDTPRQALRSSCHGSGTALAVAPPAAGSR